MPSNAEIVEATNKYLMGNYPRFPIAMVRGSGARIWDADGKEYIDFFAGFGAAGVAGHSHPAVVEAVQDQVAKLQAHGNLFTNMPQVELARAVSEHSFGGKVFLCHGGADSVEAALKLMRLAAGEGRYKIISFENSFHGRTMGALSLTPAKYQKGFEPMLPGNVMVPYGDIDAVAAAVDEQTAGVIVEPIQGEGGVNHPPQGFMEALRALCDDRGLLLTCDEVWTGPARTGKWFAYQHYDITPDVMTVAKAIGGGLPVGVCIAAAKWSDVLVPGTHASTMGGNPVCAAAGAATMKLIEDEDLVNRAQQTGGRIMDAIRDARIGCVKEVRGAGMMIGIELDKPGNDIVLQCMERGLLINCTQQVVLRLSPPLVTPDEDIQQGLDILLDVLRK